MTACRLYLSGRFPAPLTTLGTGTRPAVVAAVASRRREQHGNRGDHGVALGPQSLGQESAETSTMIAHAPHLSGQLFVSTMTPCGGGAIAGFDREVRDVMTCPPAEPERQRHPNGGNETQHVARVRQQGCLQPLPLSLPQDKDSGAAIVAIVTSRWDYTGRGRLVLSQAP